MTKILELELTDNEYEKIDIQAKAEGVTVEELILGWLRWYGDDKRSDTESYP